MMMMIIIIITGPATEVSRISKGRSKSVLCAGLRSAMGQL